MNKIRKTDAKELLEMLLIVLVSSAVVMHLNSFVRGANVSNGKETKKEQCINKVDSALINADTIRGNLTNMSKIKAR